MTCCAGRNRTRGPAGCRAAGGWSVLHMVSVLVLLAIFMVVASKLFMATVHATKDATERQEQIWQLEGVISKLRQDVWGAVQVHAPGEQHLELTMPNGKSITWRADGGLSRSESGGSSLSWPQLTSNIRFAVTPGLVQLHLPDESAAGEATVVMVALVDGP